MRVISFNTEGVLSAVKNGFLNWVKVQDADVICLQDLRISRDDLHSKMYALDGYYLYSGGYNYYDENNLIQVAMYVRSAPKAIISETGFEVIDSRGCYLQADFDHISVSSFLVPGQSCSAENFSQKIEVLDAYMLFLKKHTRKRRELITCGTLNVVHNFKDIAHLEKNEIHQEKFQEEKKWMDQLLNELHYIDCYREIDANAQQYSFWKDQESREENLGSRIDYQIATKNMRLHVLSSGLYRREFFSRHAPLVVDYEWDLNTIAQ